jgi:hypothetical protein
MQTKYNGNNVLTIGGEKGHIVEEVDNDSVFVNMYNSSRWKMIPNCTGRYTCRDHKVVSKLKPMDLIHRIQHLGMGHDDEIVHADVDAVVDAGTGAGTGTGTGTDGGSVISTSNLCNGKNEIGFRQYQFTFPNNERKDPILVIPFEDSNQTGLITYIKTNSSSSELVTNETPKQSFVHTLNAPSGFQRKLEAIGIIVTKEGVLIQKEINEDGTNDKEEDSG